MVPKERYRSVLCKEDDAYLRKRGYTPEDLEEEEVRSFGVGDITWAGISWRAEVPGMAFIVRSMSGGVAGIHTATREKKEYRFFKSPGKEYLPIIYGSLSDLQLLYRKREMILVEGVFDRIAMKRFSRTLPVFARLSKGISDKLTLFVERYADRLWLAFDMDSPGRSATEKALERIRPTTVVYDMELPRKDPGELLELDGLTRGKFLVERALRFRL